MIKILRLQQRFSGRSGISAFTLTELLVAAAITSCAIAMSGFGLSAMLSSSIAVNESTEQQDELNRALDFISAEIREADDINTGGDVNTFLGSDATEYRADFPSEIDTATIQEILWLNVAGQKVVYYVVEPDTDNGLWRSPQMVYRWGPKFKDDGTYDSNTDHAILIDSLHDEINGGAEPSCRGWTEAIDPALAKNLGFYACIAPGNKAATLSKVGQMNKVLGQQEPILQERQVYSRASVSSAPRFPSLDGGAPSCVGVACGGGDSIEEEDPGYVITRDLDELTLDNRGGAISCGPGGSNIATEATAILMKPDGTTRTINLLPNNPEVMVNIPSGTKVKLTARTNGPCGFQVNSEYDIGTQIIMLADGQRVPYYEPFDRQSKIDEFLTTEELPSNDNVLTLANNQRILLFELGERFSSTPGPAYDFQDVVLVVDMKPRRQNLSPSSPSDPSLEPDAQPDADNVNPDVNDSNNI